MTFQTLQALLHTNPPTQIEAQALQPLETDGPFPYFISRHPARHDVTYVRYGDWFIRQDR